MPTEPAWMSTTDNSPEPAWMSTAPDQTFGEALREYGRKMGGVVTGLNQAIRHPIEFTKNWHAQNEQLGQMAVDAYDKGDYRGAARHAANYFINMLPGMGAASDEAGSKLEQGDIAGGLADTAAVGTQAALGIKAPAIMEGAGRLTSATGAGLKAATPGLIKGAGNIVLGSGLGELLPAGPMRYVAAGSPIFRGARQISSALGNGFTAGRESLFPPPIRPTPVPAIGDDAAAMYAAQQARLNSQATAPTATTATPPPLGRLNSGVVAPPRSQTPVRAQSGAGAESSPIDRIASAPQSAVQPPAAMLARLNSAVNPRAAAQNLFNEMKVSGSVPPTARPGQPYGGEPTPPDRFIAAAREARATGTDQLAEALYTAGVRSSRLSTVTPDQWALFAKNTGVSWPIGRPAQLAWIKDTIAAIRQREGQVQ